MTLEEEIADHFANIRSLGGRVELAPTGRLKISGPSKILPHFRFISQNENDAIRVFTTCSGDVGGGGSSGGPGEAHPTNTAEAACGHTDARPATRPTAPAAASAGSARSYTAQLDSLALPASPGLDAARRAAAWLDEALADPDLGTVRTYGGEVIPLKSRLTALAGPLLRPGGMAALGGQDNASVDPGAFAAVLDGFRQFAAKEAEFWRSERFHWPKGRFPGENLSSDGGSKT